MKNTFNKEEMQDFIRDIATQVYNSVHKGNSAFIPELKQQIGTLTSQYENLDKKLISIENKLDVYHVEVEQVKLDQAGTKTGVKVLTAVAFIVIGLVGTIYVLYTSSVQGQIKDLKDADQAILTRLNK